MSAPQNNNLNSPHLNNLQQNGSAPASPAMSNPAQNNGGPRPGYADPNAYASPALAGQNYYAPPQQQQQQQQQQQHNEQYRASPTGSNGSMSLPSMRSLDSMQQQQQQQGHHMGSPLPHQGAPMGQQYYHNAGQILPPPSHGYPGVTSDPNAMRYVLPIQHDNRIMSGGRHKKEIKRRTKTGCLTCRKRRIKCDEGMPSCRNCQKSKRECQGYDPVFKNAPGPAAIQPAPSSAPLASGVPTTAHPYGNQPHLLASAIYGTGSMAYDSAALGVTGASHPYDYNAAIDPALEASAVPTTAAGVPYHQTSPGKRTLNDLLALGGAPPPPPAVDINTQPQQLDEVKHLYYSIYAPGLESFLESKWFSVKGLQKLLEAKPLLDQFASLLAQFAKTTPNDPKEIQYTTSVEARVVWALANMVRTTANETNAVPEYNAIPTNDDPREAGNRLTVFETLLTGKVATSNVLTPAVVGNNDHHKMRELEFWYHLGNFVTLQDGEGEAAAKIDDTLSSLRNLLDGRENRDVLYSIAVVRAIGPRVAEYTNEDTPLHLDESDNKSKLLVAKKFVADEAAGNGTTNVIRRLCELANRSWSPPTIIPAASTPTPAGYAAPPAPTHSAPASNPTTPAVQ